MKNNNRNTEPKTGQNAEISIHEQVRQEFEHAEDRGEPELEQLKNELNEPHHTLPSPMISSEDAAFANRNPNQMGEALGLDIQRNEPLDPVEQIDKRDEDRWELNPASVVKNDK